MTCATASGPSKMFFVRCLTIIGGTNAVSILCCDFSRPNFEIFAIESSICGPPEHGPKRGRDFLRLISVAAELTQPKKAGGGPLAQALRKDVGEGFFLAVRTKHIQLAAPDGATRELARKIQGEWGVPRNHG
jgi:hypothetical protein